MPQLADSCQLKLERFDGVIESDLNVQLAHIDLALARLSARRNCILDLMAKDFCQDDRHQNVFHKTANEGADHVYTQKSTKPLIKSSDGINEAIAVQNLPSNNCRSMSRDFHCPATSAGEAILISELKKTPNIPFDGNPIDFHRWYTYLSTKIDQLHISAVDSIEIFIANTIGKPRELIKMISASYGISPEMQLSEVKSELIKRFGSKKLGAYILYNNLIRHPRVRGAGGSLQMARSLRSLSDACNKVGKAVKNTPYLDHLNFQSGLDESRVKNKLPRYLVEEWRKIKYKCMTTENKHPQFEIFCNFLAKEADSLCEDKEIKVASLYSRRAKEKHGARRGNYWQKPTQPVKNHQQDQFCAIHKTLSHNTMDCKTFIHMDRDQKWMFCRKNLLCKKCLKQHDESTCPSEIPSGIIPHAKRFNIRYLRD